MEPLLYLTHRIPFPPNKGDKVRSHHVLRHLASRYRVHLGTFVDDDADWRHVEAARALCADAYFARLHPLSKPLRGLSGLLGGEPLTVSLWRDAGLQAWVDRTLASAGIAKAVVFSSAMAQYVRLRPGLRWIVDFVDVDSEKWRQFAATARWPLSSVYRREARTLLEFERKVARETDACFFVTEQETDLFRRRAPESAKRAATCGNGVDSAWFSPQVELASPYRAAERAIVFTGAMDYWPNVDAVCWFARSVLPLVRRVDHAATFHIVGMNPAPAVRALASDPAVNVTGRVDDVRPYLRHADVVVVPLRVARGIQNKVLEAMAMAKAVVASSNAASALIAAPGLDIEVASSQEEFAKKVVDLLDTPRAAEVGRKARERVLRDYDWASNLRRLDQALDAGEPGRDDSRRSGRGPKPVLIAGASSR
jgi:sugar transferase (PEP-CTERM/EpsH1 system associated)